MSVAQFQAPQVYNVAKVRNAARDLRDALEHLRQQTEKALAGVQSGRSIASVLLHYAKWLGRWHSANLFTTWQMHFRDAQLSEGRLAVAALQLKSDIRSIEALVARKDHWIAVPNVENVRRILAANLALALTSIHSALASCAILEGHQPEGDAA